MLADAIDPDCVFLDIQAEEKEDVLRLMTEKLCQSRSLAPCPEILQAVLERERDRSTGIERGLAVPHCRTSAVNRIHIALAVIHQGIEWDSLDGGPAQYIFLVVGPNDNPEEYLKLLSQISRLMKSDAVREKLSKARTPEEVIETLRED